MKEIENALKILALKGVLVIIIVSIILIGAIITSKFLAEETSFNEYMKYERQIERAYLDSTITQDGYNEMIDFLRTTGYSSDAEFNEDLKAYKSMYK